MNIQKILVQIITFIYLFSISLSIFACGDADKNYRDYIEVTESNFEYSSSEDWSSITTIGKLKNNFDTELANIVLQVEYFDGSSVLIDTYTDELYSNVIPAAETISFSLRSNAAKEKERYISNKVTVTYSKLKKPCKKKKSLWLKAVISWAPIFIIIFIWVVLYKKSRGKAKRPHLEMIEELVDLSKESNKQYKRIADSLENISTKKDKS